MDSSVSRPSGQSKKDGAWIVLLTRPSYLPGVILLGHSLKKVGSKYPLVVAVTDTLPQYAVDALKDSSLEVKHIDPIKPKDQVDVVAERFEDTWTKLAAFGFEEYKKAVLIDGDMLVLKNMDNLFEMPLDEDWIAANHACVCNLDKAEWAPEDWLPENCAYTPVSHPQALTEPTPVTPSSTRTHKMLNSGLVVFTPSMDVLNSMLHLLYTSPIVATFSFPDQDFLAHFYSGRWKPLGWQYNAIKTARYWHPGMWNDDAALNLHYIVDKPWNTGRKIGDNDEVTHGWWWDEFGEWKNEMEKKGKIDTLGSVSKHMCQVEA